MSTKYRFSINGQSVNPIYKDDLSKDYELESQQRYYRAKLSGNLTFIRDDFDWIKAQTFQTEFVLLIERYLNGAWEDYWTGVFYKTDGKWDEDNRTVTVKLDVKDQYTEVLAGIENEYNLIKLSPAKTPLEIQKRPLIQVYIPGDSVVSCFLGGNYWEQDTAFEEDSTSALINTYYFAKASTLHKIYVSGIEGTPLECVGDYVAEGTSPTTFWGRNTYDISGEEIYKITFDSLNKRNISVFEHDKTSDDLGSIWQDSKSSDYWQLVAIPDANTLTMIQYFHSGTIYCDEFGTNNFTHIRGATNTSTISYTYVDVAVSSNLYALRKSSDETIMFVSKIAYDSLTDGVIDFIADQGTGTFDGYKYTIEVYMRYLLDVETISGLTTYELPADDLVGDNRNYSRAIGYAIDQITITANANVEATEYGIMDDGLYFVEPPGFPSYYKYFPVARSTWGYSSIWFNFDLLNEILEEKGRKPYTMKDSMLISDVIKVLLAEIDPTISHEGTSDYSEFLYSDTNPITYGEFRVMITQKSNILAGEYDRPAQKAPTTLSEIMTMLRDTFQLYWYIENNMFKIEHVIWFKNGGSYSSSSILTADLTTLESLRNKKKWGLYTSNYDYEKQDLAERMEFNWMDEVTEGFDGFPIEINSKFVQRGKKDTISVSNFTTDVDYMLLNPSAINQDGFALFAAIDTELTGVPEAENGYYVYNTGAFVANSTRLSKMVDISIYEDGVELYVSSSVLGSGTAMAVFYDDSMTYLGYQNRGQSPGIIYTDEKLIIPTGTKYVGLTSYYTYGYAVIRPFAKYKLPFIERTINDATLRLQNGYMSWIYLHPNFWTYDLPASDVTINDNNYVTVYGIQRKKKQTVIYPSIEDPDPYKLVKTYLGNGQIDKLSINLSSRMNEIQLKYDTE